MFYIGGRNHSCALVAHARTATHKKKLCAVDLRKQKPSSSRYMLYSEGVHAADANKEDRRASNLPYSFSYIVQCMCVRVYVREYVACVSVQHKHFAGMPTVQMHTTELGWQRFLLAYTTYVACLSAKNNQ